MKAPDSELGDEYYYGAEGQLAAYKALNNKIVGQGRGSSIPLLASLVQE